MPYRKILLTAFLLLGAAVLAPAQQVVEEIVAIVNDDIITRTVYMAEYEAAMRDAQSRFRGEELDKQIEEIRTNLLDRMITEKLLLQIAKAQNFNVTDRVKEVVANLMKQNAIESEDDLKRALAQQGYAYDSWIKNVEDSIMRDMVLSSEIRRKLVIDDAEIVDYYKKHRDEFKVEEEYQLQAVYLAIGDKDPAALEAKKAGIDAKIKGGAPLAEVSAAESDEPMKEAKGSLGSFKKGELDKTLLAAVEPLKKGEMSSWVQTKNGWYLLRVEDKKDSRILEFEEARGPITEKIGMAKQNAELTKYLAELKTKNFIKILNPKPFEEKR